MDPDLFITIAFSSFVFVAGMTGLILMTVMVVRSHRRAEGPYEQEWLPAANAQSPRRSTQLGPSPSGSAKPS